MCTPWPCARVVQTYTCFCKNFVCTVHVTPFLVLHNYRAEYLTNEISSTRHTCLTTITNFDRRFLNFFHSGEVFVWTYCGSYSVSFHSFSSQKTAVLSISRESASILPILRPQDSFIKMLDVEVGSYYLLLRQFEMSNANSMGHGLPSRIAPVSRFVGKHATFCQVFSVV